MALTAADLVAREQAKGRKLRFSGSVWRLGRSLQLTARDGSLTDAGSAFQAQSPSSVSLSHYNHRSERITGSQMRARDASGQERIVAK